MINQEIWLAYQSLAKIAQKNLPVKTSLAVATLMAKLQMAYKVVESERKRIIRKYGTLNTETNQSELILNSVGGANYARDFGELLIEEWEDEIQFKRLNLPMKVTEVCVKCGNENKVDFRIEPNTLVNLIGKC